jgi:hypothetical protein
VIKAQQHNIPAEGSEREKNRRRVKERKERRVGEI